MAIAIPQPRYRRSWPQRALITFNCLLIAVCLAGAGWIGYLYNRFETIPREQIIALLDPDGDGVKREPVRPGEPKNILLVGSDSRQFADTDEEAESFGSAEDYPETEARADTILLVRIDPKARTAAMVSFPRDLVVDIAGTERRDRINTAFSGGPNQLVATVSNNFGVDIDNYVQVTFEGFRGLVDAVGGVQVYLRGPVRDRDSAGRNLSGLNITDTGCVSLAGDQALAYVRSRHFEQFIDDPNDRYENHERWVADRASDFGRIKRQQDFIMRAVGKAVEEGLLNPSQVTRLLDVADQSVRFDDRFGLSEVTELAAQFEAFRPETVQTFDLPVVDDTGREGAALLQLGDPLEVARIFGVFRGETPDPAGAPAVTPADVTLQVLNGSGAEGEATDADDGFEAAGFTTVTPGDASPYEIVTTTIRHAPGQAAAAALVARHLAAEPLIEEVLALDGVDLVVLTGQDYDGVSLLPGPPRTTTTSRGSAPTTVAPTTSTTLSEQETLAQFYAGVGQAECYRSE